jgi:hypothetical protein
MVILRTWQKDLARVLIMDSYFMDAHDYKTWQEYCDVHAVGNMAGGREAVNTTCRVTSMT